MYTLRESLRADWYGRAGRLLGDVRHVVVLRSDLHRKIPSGLLFELASVTVRRFRLIAFTERPVTNDPYRQRLELAE